jgi:hypothetical protein
MKKRVTFTLSEELITALQTLRKTQGVSAAYVVETGTRRFLDAEYGVKVSDKPKKR